jgi:HEPN domain-containing protein
MVSRALDWLRQAERDFEHASESCAAGRHEWACFAAQQSADKAAKGLHLDRGQEAWVTWSLGCSSSCRMTSRCHQT